MYFLALLHVCSRLGNHELHYLNAVIFVAVAQYDIYIIRMCAIYLSERVWCAFVLADGHFMCSVYLCTVAQPLWCSSFAACLLLSLQIRGHCVADLDPLEITQARHADTEEEARSKFLTTYRYHTVYNIGKVAPWSSEVMCATDVCCHLSADVEC